MTTHYAQEAVFAPRMPTTRLVTVRAVLLGSLPMLAARLEELVAEHVGREGDDPDLGTLAMTVERLEGVPYVKIELSMETR